MTVWESKLQEIALLKSDWDSYKGNAISKQAVTAVSEIIPILLSLGVPEPYVIPMSTGGIALEWHKGESELSIEISEYGAITSFFLYGNHLISFELNK